MKRDEQHKMILRLRESSKNMSSADREAFEMMLKRDRDDEDLDSLALQELNRLFEHYVAKRGREDLEAQWKKLTNR